VIAVPHRRASFDAERGAPRSESATVSLEFAHPVLTAAIIGPRTMEQLDGLLDGAGVVLSDELLDRIDEIVPPGVDVAPLEGSAYSPPSITEALLRRRPITERTAA